MNNKLFPVYIIGAGLIVAAYFTFFNKGKSWAIKIIYETGNYSLPKSNLESLGTDYLVAWAKAAKDGQEFFFLQGVKYSVKGGKRVA